MQVLRDAEAEPVAHVERRWTSLGMRVVWVLWKPLRNSSRGTRATNHLTCVVDRLAPRVARLDAGAAVNHRT